ILRPAGSPAPPPAGPPISLHAPLPIPPLLPSIIFPLGPPFCGDECRAERALGAAEFFPVASRQESGRGTCRGKEMRGRRRERLGVESRTRYKPAIRLLSRTAVTWGTHFSSSAPSSSPAPPFDHFPFGPAILRRRVPS